VAESDRIELDLPSESHALLEDLAGKGIGIMPAEVVRDLVEL